MVKLVERYKRIPNPHVVSIYRGSLPMGVHLSNALGCPMSIVKYQSRDGEDNKAEWILNLIHDEKLRPTARFFPHLIVVDDIYDTGYTMDRVIEFVKLYRWIVFPWERVKGGM